MFLWLTNLLVPGAGLIVLRREWLGLALALVFAICGNLALAGGLIAPQAIPLWLTVLAGVLFAVTWLASQLLFQQRRREIAARRQRLGSLLCTAHSALAAGDYCLARTSLVDGADLDEECVEWHVLWARLRTCEGDLEAGHEAWRRVLQLDYRREYRAEATQALHADA